MVGFMVAGIVSHILERFAPYTTTMRGTYPLVKFTHSLMAEQVLLEHYEGARTPPFWRHRYIGENGEEDNSVPCGHCSVHYDDTKEASVTIYDRKIDPQWKHFVISFGVEKESCTFIIPRGSAPDVEGKSLRIRSMGVVNP
jgi:hypothetical protein